MRHGGKRVDATSVARHLRITRVGRILALSACAVALPAVADDTVFEGYDAFYATLPDPLFTTVDESSQPDGIVFDGWQLHGGAFARTTASMRVVFAEPGNVYRFRRVPPEDRKSHTPLLEIGDYANPIDKLYPVPDRVYR